MNYIRTIATVVVLLFCIFAVPHPVFSNTQSEIKSTLNEAKADSAEAAETKDNTIVLFQWDSIVPFSGWYIQRSESGSQSLKFGEEGETTYTTTEQTGKSNSVVIINLGDRHQNKNNRVNVTQTGNNNRASIIQN